MNNLFSSLLLLATLAIAQGMTCDEAKTCGDCLLAKSSLVGADCQWCTTGRLPNTPCLSTWRLGGMLACSLEGGPVEDRGGWVSTCPAPTEAPTTAPITPETIANDPSTAGSVADLVGALNYVIDEGLGSPQLAVGMDAAVCTFWAKNTQYMIDMYASTKTAYDEQIMKNPATMAAWLADACGADPSGKSCVDRVTEWVQNKAVNNAAFTKLMDAYKERLAPSSKQWTTGGANPAPPNVCSSGGGSGGSGGGDPSATRTTPAPTDAPKKSGLPSGAIAGIAAGSVVLIAGATVLLMRRRRRDDEAGGAGRAAAGAPGVALTIDTKSGAMAKGMSPQHVKPRNAPLPPQSPTHSYSPFASGGGQKNPMHAARKANQAPGSSWVKQWDPSAQANYFYNTASGETQWEPPSAFCTTVSPR